MLREGCIKTYQATPDELRISVMSRHTDNGGVNPDPEIKTSMFDRHWPELGPAPNAIGPYHRGEIGWAEFRKLYKDRLDTNPDSIGKMFELARMAAIGDVVVLCVESEPFQCHRGILLEHMGVLFPNIDIISG